MTLVQTPPRDLAEFFAGLQTVAHAQRLDPAPLWRARRFIDHHFAERIDLDAMAQAAALSRYHFLRAFRRTFDRTPHQYLTKCRIDAAKELLEHSDLPVIEVCFAVGYESLGSFSQLFVRHTGHPPGRYRARLFVSPGMPAAPPMAIPGCFLAAFAGAA